MNRKWIHLDTMFSVECLVKFLIHLCSAAHHLLAYMNISWQISIRIVLKLIRISMWSQLVFGFYLISLVSVCVAQILPYLQLKNGTVSNFQWNFILLCTLIVKMWNAKQTLNYGLILFVSLSFVLISNIFIWRFFIWSIQHSVNIIIVIGKWPIYY